MFNNELERKLSWTDLGQCPGICLGVMVGLLKKTA
jgi:hypothetical protein